MSLFDLPRLVFLQSVLPHVGGWNLKHKELQPAADAFSFNHDRVHALLLQTPIMIHASHLHTHVHTAAHIHTFGFDGPMVLSGTTEEQERRYREYVSQAAERHNAERAARLTEYAIGEVQFGVERFEELIDAHKDTSDLCRGVEALISSVLVLSCTALDVLFADLCRAVADPAKHPALKFGSLTTIRESYERVFQSDGTVMGMLRNTDLDALAQVRHLLVHRAGRVDQEYLKKTAAIAQLPTLGLHDPFPLNGILANDLIRNAIQRGKELVDAVDAFLVDHPTPF